MWLPRPHFLPNFPCTYSITQLQLRQLEWKWIWFLSFPSTLLHIFNLSVDEHHASSTGEGGGFAVVLKNTYLYVYKCFVACMYVHYVGTVPMEAREGARSPGTGAKDHCESHASAGNPGPGPGKASALNYWAISPGPCFKHLEPSTNQWEATFS